MTTTETAARIAREYGAHLAKDIPEPNCLKNEIIRSTEDYIAEFMQWLCKTHCIAAKNKVAELYKCGFSGMSGAQTKKILSYIFGKSLFEEKP